MRVELGPLYEIMVFCHKNAPLLGHVRTQKPEPVVIAPAGTVSREQCRIVIAAVAGQVIPVYGAGIFVQPHQVGIAARSNAGQHTGLGIRACICVFAALGMYTRQKYGWPYYTGMQHHAGRFVQTPLDRPPRSGRPDRVIHKHIADLHHVAAQPEGPGPTAARLRGQSGRSPYCRCAAPWQKNRRWGAGKCWAATAISASDWIKVLLQGVSGRQGTKQQESCTPVH